MRDAISGENRTPGKFALSVGPTDMPAPEGWQWVSLCEVARMESGHTPSRRYPKYWGGEIPWLGIRDAKDHHGQLILDTQQHITPLGLENSSCRVLPESTVCLSRTASIGYAVMLARPMATSQDFLNWICSSAVHPPFLMHLFIAEHESLLEFGKGTTHKTIYFSEAKRFRVCLPSVQLQQRIASKVSVIGQRCEQMREQLVEIERLADHLGQLSRVAAFEGRLTLPDTPEHGIGEDTAIEVVRARRRNFWMQETLAGYKKRKRIPPANWEDRYAEIEPVDSSTVPGLPAGWVWAAAEEVVEPGCDIVYGILQPGKHVPGGVPYVRGMDIIDGAIAVDQLKRTSAVISRRYARSTLKAGDVLLGIIRATKVAVVPGELDGANITQGTARFRPCSMIRTGFLAEWLNSPFAQQWLHAHYRGIDMPGLNLQDVRRLPIPLPSLVEQEAIERRLADVTAKIARIRESIAGLRVRVRDLSVRISEFAFGGRLVSPLGSDSPIQVDIGKAQLVAETQKASRMNTRKKSRQVTPKREPVDEVRALVTAIAADTFSFDEVFAEYSADYESLKEAFFTLLSDDTPLFDQFFDDEVGQIRFRRLVK